MPRPPRESGSSHLGNVPCRLGTDPQPNSPKSRRLDELSQRLADCILVAKNSLGAWITAMVAITIVLLEHVSSSSKAAIILILVPKEKLLYNARFGGYCVLKTQ